MKYKMSLVFLLSFSLSFCVSTQKKLEKQRAKDPQYQYNVGLVYLQNNNVEQAARYFKRSLALRPGFDLALNAMGLVSLMKGEFQPAVEYFEKCLQVNPKLTEAHNYLGTVYQELGILDKAEEHYKLAIADEAYRSRELPYYNLAKLYLAQDKDKEALEMVERSLSLNGNLVMALNLKGILLERAGRMDDAIACYEKGIRIVPEDVNLNFNLAVAYFKTDRRDEAKTLFERIYPRVTDPELKAKIDEYLRVLR